MRNIILLLAIVPSILSQEYIPISHYAPNSAPVAVKIDAKDAKCLAVTIYGEARSEPEKGMIAVAYTVITRSILRKKAVCSIALAPKQYSIFNGNPALRAAAMSPHLEPIQKNEIDKQDWAASMKVAESVLKKEVEDPTKGATHYIAPIVMRQKRYTTPGWTKTFTKMGTIGNHVFFKEKI